MLAQLICLIIVSATSTYIGYQLGLWAKDEINKYGSLRNTIKYTVIEWIVDWAYDINKNDLDLWQRNLTKPNNKKTGKEKSRQNMTDYERKLDYLIHSEELPF